MKKMNKQKGFTIIELVVVILLLGILTATALPRFMDVTDEAHDAVVEGVLAGLATSSGLFRASWYAEGQNTTVADYGLNANTAGYALGTGTILRTGIDCSNIFTTFLQAPGRPALEFMTTTGAMTAAEISAVAYEDADFIAKGANGICRYAYVGQFNDAVTATNPVIEYTGATGIFTMGTSL